MSYLTSCRQFMYPVHVNTIEVWVHLTSIDLNHRYMMNNYLPVVAITAGDICNNESN